MDNRVKVPARLRHRVVHMCDVCRRYTESCVDIEFGYATVNVAKAYDGDGEKGTGGPKLE